MALWHLLLLICIGTPIAASLAVARRATAGIGGYAIAIIVGLALSAFFGWTTWATHRTVANRLESSPHPKEDWFTYGLYFSKIVWIILAAFVGLRLTSWLLRVVF